MKRFTQIISLFCTVVFPVVTYGQIVVDFSTGPGLTDFDGLQSGGAVLLNDRGGGVYNGGNSRYGLNYDSVFTLVDVEFATGSGGTDDAQQLNTSANGLGVANAANVDKESFDWDTGAGDFMRFNLSVEGSENGLIILDEFEFSDLGNNEFFTLASEGFKMKGYTGNGSDILFDEDLGQFTFLGSDFGDGVFRLTDDMNFEVSKSVFINESDDLTLAFGQIDPTFTGGTPEAAFLKSFTFHAIPEQHPWVVSGCGRWFCRVPTAEKES